MRRGLLIIAVLLAVLAVALSITSVIGTTTTLLLLGLAVILGLGSFIT